MGGLRLIHVFILSLPVWAGTWNVPIVANPQGQLGISDIVLDEGRRRVYLVNTPSNQINIYRTDVTTPGLSSSVRVGATPLSAAMSRNGKYLYVACYDASALSVIDLDRLAVVNTVTLAAKPEGVAVAYDEKVLVSTIGTGQGQAVL